jgi:adenosylhomocysteinase
MATPVLDTSALSAAPPPASAARVVTQQVRATGLERDSLPSRTAAWINELVEVTRAEAVPGGLRLHLATEARILLLAESPHRPEAELRDTVLLTAFCEDPGLTAPTLLAEVLATVERQPFLSVEWDELQAQMPLTSHLPDCLDPGLLNDVAPVLTVHHMSDFLVLVDAVRRLGAPPQAITVLDKGYSYLHTRRVDAHLAAMGVRVFPWKRAVEALDDHAGRAAALGRRGLLVDDGGYTLPVLIEQRPDLLPQFCGLVEQTISGITKLAAYGQLPMPVFSVAQSRLKSTIEPFGVADAAVRNVLRLLPNEKFEGRPALVLGYGRIGRQLAEILRTRRMRVAVYDHAIAPLVAAHEQGFVTARTLPDLLQSHQPMLIVGATGSTSLLGEHAAYVGADCYAVSTTSRQHEFAVQDLTNLAVTVRDLGTTGTELKLPSGSRLTLIGDGFPVNFHHAESMPNRYSDLIMAAMVMGAVSLARPGHAFQDGHNLEQTDRVLESCGLLERYLDQFGPK